MPVSSEPVLSETCRLWISNGVFGVTSPQIPWVCRAESGGNGLVYPRPDGCEIYTGIHVGDVDVSLQLHRQAPELDHLLDWECVVEVSFPAARVLEVRSEEGEGMVVDVLALGVDGEHLRCRAHARGRDEDWDSGAGDILEKYLVQLWPAPRSVEHVYKLEDEAGQARREW